MVTNLKKLRALTGTSQKQLADIIHVSQQSVNKYENHDVEPNIDTLCDIANHFNVSLDYLVGRTEIMRINENVSKYDLNSNEQEMIDAYRLLSAPDKELITNVLNRLLKK